MTTTAYLVEPKAPLVFRSGKPFGAGSRDGANLPAPSAWAGLMRTTAMEARGWRPRLSAEQQGELLELPAAGPFLCRRDDKGRIEPFLPKPADAVCLQGDTAGDGFRRLGPVALPDGVGCDLPPGLLPVGFVEGRDKAKPKPTATWWSLTDWMAWALEGKRRPPEGEDAWRTVEERTHVGIDARSQAADEGRLFQTQGWDFSPQRQSRGGFAAHQWLFLGLGPAEAGARAGRLVHFGGERRLSHLCHAGDNPLACPAGWRQRIGEASRFAVTLVTPGLFSRGWCPGWLDETLCGELPQLPGRRLRLTAALVERWQPLSGWCLHEGKPKATRRAVAAGATYWFEVCDGGRIDAGALWLASACDDPQDRRDGFGLMLPRPWL